MVACVLVLMSVLGVGFIMHFWHPLDLPYLCTEPQFYFYKARSWKMIYYETVARGHTVCRQSVCTPSHTTRSCYDHNDSVARRQHNSINLNKQLKPIQCRPHNTLTTTSLCGITQPTIIGMPGMGTEISQPLAAALMRHQLLHGLHSCPEKTVSHCW